MSVHEVPPGEWCSFLERFGREHRAWRATIHGIEAGVVVTRVPSEAIRSIRLEQHVPDPIVRIAFVNGVSLCAPAPAAVRVQQTHEGADAAMEVDTVAGAFLRVAFRSVALPEQLDGLAPGEVARRSIAGHS